MTAQKKERGLVRLTPQVLALLAQGKITGYGKIINGKTYVKIWRTKCQ